jgi:hypothetical protein
LIIRLVALTLSSNGASGMFLLTGFQNSIAYNG